MLEHIILASKIFIDLAVPDVPHWIRVETAKQEHFRREAFKVGLDVFSEVNESVHLTILTFEFIQCSFFALWKNVLAMLLSFGQHLYEILISACEHFQHATASFAPVMAVLCSHCVQRT